MRLYAVKKTPALGSPKSRSFFYCFSVGVSSLFMQRAYASRSLRLRTKAAARSVTGRAMTQTSTPVSPVAGVLPGYLRRYHRAGGSRWCCGRAPATGSAAKPTDQTDNFGNTTSPKTGDSSNLVLWIALLFISGGAVIGTTVVSQIGRAHV